MAILLLIGKISEWLGYSQLRKEFMQVTKVNSFTRLGNSGEMIVTF